MTKTPPENRFKYTPSNPQPPASPLLAEYMRIHSIDKSMPFEAAKEWFDSLNAALKKKERERFSHDKD